MSRKGFVGVVTGVLLSVLCVVPAFAGGRDVGMDGLFLILALVVMFLFLLLIASFLGI